MSETPNVFRSKSLAGALARFTALFWVLNLFIFTLSTVLYFVNGKEFYRLTALTAGLAFFAPIVCVIIIGVILWVIYGEESQK